MSSQKRLLLRAILAASLAATSTETNKRVSAWEPVHVSPKTEQPAVGFLRSSTIPTATAAKPAVSTLQEPVVRPVVVARLTPPTSTPDGERLLVLSDSESMLSDGWLIEADSHIDSAVTQWNATTVAYRADDVVPVPASDAIQKPSPADKPAIPPWEAEVDGELPPKVPRTSPKLQPKKPPEAKTEAVESAAFADLPSPPTVLQSDNFGLVTLSLIDASAAALSRNPNIRVVSKTPQIFRNDITIEDAFFDPQFNVRVEGAKDDYQLTDNLQSFGGNFTTNRRDVLRPLGGINNLSISQQLRSGGEYELGVGTAYEYFKQVGPLRIFNPAWDSAINLHVEQPLLAGRGRAIAESRIEIAQVTSRQTGELFRAEVNIILRDVETAYWDLALLEQQTLSYKSQIELSGGLVKAEKDRLDLGDGVLPDVIEAREQYIAALASATDIEGQRREVSQQLANLLGYPAADPVVIQTTTPASPGLYLPVLEEGVARMMLRPELDAQRSSVRIAEIELRRQINGLQPDLRLYLDYAVTGLAARLDDSLETVVDNQYNYAALGFVLQQPIGRRAAFAHVRRAQLTLCQERQQLESLQHQYAHHLIGIHKQLEAQREAVMFAAQRVALAKEQYKLRLELRNEGEGTLDSVLRTQQRLLTAETTANEALYDYQKLLVLWYYEQGALSDDRISIAN